jgi:hypothetical protein
MLQLSIAVDDGVLMLRSLLVALITRYSFLLVKVQNVYLIMEPYALIAIDAIPGRIEYTFGLTGIGGILGHSSK